MYARKYIHKYIEAAEEYEKEEVDSPVEFLLSFFSLSGTYYYYGDSSSDIASRSLSYLGWQI